MTDCAAVQKLKFIIVGDSAVGKSCLLLQLTDRTFRESYDPTIGVEFGACVVPSGGSTLKLQVWDTAGQETFRSITRSYYRGAAGALIVYDVTRRETFTHVASWLGDVVEAGTRNMSIILVGNKNDLADKRGVSEEEGRQFAEKHGLLFVEISATSPQGALQPFVQLAGVVWERVQRGDFTLE